MHSARQHTHSLWQENENPIVYPALLRDVTTDVCVVGAGMSGLMTAYCLLKEGKPVVVVDKEIFGANETGLSSAHVSNVLDDGFAELRRLHGARGLQLAVESHTAAIDLIEKIAQDENIDCDFKRVDGYLFCGPKDGLDHLQQELRAAQEGGIHDVEMVTQAPLTSFDSGPCLRFGRQAQMNPFLFISGVAKAIEKMGGRIYSRTHVTHFSTGPELSVTTENGHMVRCEHLVVATNVPINDIFAIHNKEAAYRTYVVGARVPHGTFPQVLLWDTEEPYHYVRVQPEANSDFDILLVGGEDHKTGQEADPESRFLNLEDWIQKRLNLSSDVFYRWSGQIIEPVDGLAYIGVNPGESQNVFIAAGDSGHGLTHGAIAGLLLTDLIMSRENPWEDLYSPDRVSLKGIGNYLSENLNTAWQYHDWATGGDVSSVEDIVPGQGAVVREGVAKVATYRALDGTLHRYRATCTHLGGQVHWNSVEETWDCPCHGSRYSKFGEVVNGPAPRDLTPYNEGPSRESELIRANQDWANQIVNPIPPI